MQARWADGTQPSALFSSEFQLIRQATAAA